MGINLSKDNNGFDERLLEGHGLYHIPQDYDKKKVRKLIISKKLAPFYKGLEGLEDDIKIEKMTTRNQDNHVTNDNDVIECPICFLLYPSTINYTNCCDQPICTECFVQFKRSDPTLPVSCPFCVQPRFGVIYQPPSPILSNYNDHNTRQQRRLSMFQINPISCISKDTITTTTTIHHHHQRHISLPSVTTHNNENENKLSSPKLLSSFKKGSFKKRQKKEVNPLSSQKKPMIIHIDDIRPLSSYATMLASSSSRPTSSYIISTDLATMNTPNLEDWMVFEAVRRSLQDQQDQQRRIDNSSNLHYPILC